MAFNVLIVDDSKTVRIVIEKTLKLSGVPTNSVLQACNGQEALDLIENNWIDIILADLNMPVMTGFEMIDKLQEKGLTKTIPVVVVSTESNPERIAELKRKGVRAHLRKPFRPEQFKAIVTELLGVSND